MYKQPWFLAKIKAQTLTIFRLGPVVLSQWRHRSSYGKTLDDNTFLPSLLVGMITETKTFYGILEMKLFVI